METYRVKVLLFFKTSFDSKACEAIPILSFFIPCLLLPSSQSTLPLVCHLCSGKNILKRDEVINTGWGVSVLTISTFLFFQWNLLTRNDIFKCSVQASDSLLFLCTNPWTRLCLEGGGRLGESLKRALLSWLYSCSDGLSLPQWAHRELVLHVKSGCAVWLQFLQAQSIPSNR